MFALGLSGYAFYTGHVWVHMHASTCEPVFLILGVDGRIVLEFVAWLRDHQLSVPLSHAECIGPNSVCQIQGNQSTSAKGSQAENEGVGVQLKKRLITQASYLHVFAPLHCLQKVLTGDVF